jgi:hypothetical protein
MFQQLFVTINIIDVIHFSLLFNQRVFKIISVDISSCLHKVVHSRQLWRESLSALEDCEKYQITFSF